MALFAALLHVGSCNERPEAEPQYEAHTVATQGSAASLDDLRNLARSSPQEALTALGSRSESPEVNEVRTLAQTTLFNSALKDLAGEPDLRQAIRTAISLAATPQPTNKRRLAQPVWGIIGKLERLVDSDPAFAAAAAKRLAEGTTLAELIGPQFTPRLEAIIERTDQLEIIKRVDGILRSQSFSAIVKQLALWAEQPDKVTPAQLNAATTHLIDGLHTRGEGEIDSRLRDDASALLAQLKRMAPRVTGPKADEGAQTLEALITRTGRATMERWLKTLRATSKKPTEAARHGCEAGRFAQTAAERQALTDALADTRHALDQGARKAALKYLLAIETRQAKSWRKMEQPFLGATEGPLDEFIAQRERWLAVNPRLDPRTGALQIATAELDLCSVSATLGLSRSDTTPVEVALTVCWHAERRAWFPCRPLTIANNKAMVRP